MYLIQYVNTHLYGHYKKNTDLRGPKTDVKQQKPTHKHRIYVGHRSHEKIVDANGN